MVVVIDSRADIAQEKVILAKLKKYHLGVLFLSVLAIVLLVWAVVATVISVSSKNVELVKTSSRANSRNYKSAAVVSDSGFCSEIARNVIIQGGNAVDAAIAASFCSGVVLPYANGIGGGGFMVIYLKEQKKCVFLNSREIAPSASTMNMFSKDRKSAQFGYKSIAIPGEIHGLWTAYQLYGSKVIPWNDLVQPSVRLARAFPNHQAMYAYFDRITKYEGEEDIQPLKNLFTNKLTGKFYEAGEIVNNFALAKTLNAIGLSDDPIQLFYNGSIAHEIIAEMEQHDGLITLQDLQNYQTDVTETLYSEFAGYRMCGPPPPSSWAITQLIPRIVEEKYGGREIFNDALFYHILIEAEKLAYGQRGRLGDFRFSPESLKLARNMTGRVYVREKTEKVIEESQDIAYYMKSDPSIVDAGTSHTSIVDDDGNAVSVTSTINTAFGSKMLSKFGFIYNNEMDDFSTPGLTNHWGFEPSEANYIRPGRRPMSSMSPTVVFDPKSGQVRMVTGATGGSKIISATAQTLVRALLLHQDAAEIVEQPRVHNQLTPFETFVEMDFSEKTKNKLEKEFGQDIERTDQSLAIIYPITREDEHYCAATDFRRKTNNFPAGY